MVRRQTWQESQTQISRRRWTADVGIASAISKPAAAIRLGEVLWTTLTLQVEQHFPRLLSDE
jgi:hypothetical protein